MSIIRDFVTKLPAACGVPAGLAEIYGELNGKLFDFELANPEGPLHRKHFGSVASRINLGFCSWSPLVNLDWEESHPAEHARALLEFAARTIDAKGGDWRGKDQTRAKLAQAEAQPENAPVASLMTVEQASTLGSWV